MSANAVTDRVRKLRKLGVIRRFCTDISLAALGRPLQAYIDVRLDGTAVSDDFERKVSMFRA